MGIVDSKTFKSGDGVAVSLPDAIAFAPDTRVTIERHGDTLTIRPAVDPVPEKSSPRDLVAALRALPTSDDGATHESIEFPERPGLY